MPAILRDILRDATSVYYNPEAYGGKLHREVPALRDVVVSGSAKPLKPYTHRLRCAPPCARRPQAGPS